MSTWPPWPSRPRQPRRSAAEGIAPGRSGWVAGAEAAEHAGVLEADGAGGGLDGGAVADQVLGSLQPQELLVAQRGEAGRLGELAGQGALADAAPAGDLRERQRTGEPRLDLILRAVGGVAEVAAVPQHGADLLLVPVAAGGRRNTHG